LENQTGRQQPEAEIEATGIPPTTTWNLRSWNVAANNAGYTRSCRVNNGTGIGVVKCTTGHRGEFEIGDISTRAWSKPAITFNRRFIGATA